MRRLEARAALIAASVFLAACSGEPHGASVRVIVPRGASFGQAADSLARTGIIGSAKLFTLYGRLTYVQSPTITYDEMGSVRFLDGEGNFGNKVAQISSALKILVKKLRWFI